MALRPPSLQREYDEYYSRDPAFDPPDEPEPGKTATDEQKLALDAHRERVRIARETGDWRSLVMEGANPTLFVMRPIPGSIYRAIVDGTTIDGFAAGQLTAFAFRAAVRAVKNIDGRGGELKLKLERTQFGPGFASVDVVDKLDAIDHRIVAELADEVIGRARRISPKS